MLLVDGSGIRMGHSRLEESFFKKRSKFSHRPVTFIEIAVMTLFVFSALGQATLSYAATPVGGHSVTTESSHVSSSSTVTSNGVEEPYIIMQVASSSNPNEVYLVTGAQLAQRVVGGAIKSYFYLYINTGTTFAVNTSGVVSKQTITGYSTNNMYWNVQVPPSSGSSSFYGTLGQDLDTGATSNTLSEWQWADLNYGGGGKPISYTGSYDGGGPTACYVYSNNQIRESVYVIIVNSASKAIYNVIGGVLIQQTIDGVASTTFIALVSGSQGKLVTSGDNKDCPIVTNPVSTPSLRWYVRTPPVKGAIPGATITGNFGITGTVGAGIAKASEDGNMELLQFVDRSFQTGYIPNEGCATCVSMLESTNPVGDATAPWPGPT